MDGGVEELHGDPTAEPRPKVWTRGKKWKKYCFTFLPPQRGVAIPTPLFERWVEMTRQLSQGAQPSGYSQSSGAHLQTL